MVGVNIFAGALAYDRRIGGVQETQTIDRRLTSVLELFEHGRVLDGGDVFDSEEKAYYMYVEIVPDEGFVFSDNTVITINGDAGLVDSKGWMEYSRYCWLNTVDFFVTEPEAGVIGHVDMDGGVDTADALMALRYVMGLAELDEAQLAQADVDGDGEVTMVDSLLIQRYAMGVITNFPAESGN